MEVILAIGFGIIVISCISIDMTLRKTQSQNARIIELLKELNKSREEA